MGNASRIGRLGMLTVGLGIGAAVGALPGVASADPFTPFDPNNFAISVDGITLFQVGTAHAESGIGDFAIADGANSQADAEGGFGDYASADGVGSLAVGGNNEGATDNDFDFASAVGNSSVAVAGNNVSHGAGGSADFASASGNNSAAEAGFNGNFDSASAVGDASGAGAGDNGSFDSASALGAGVTSSAGVGDETDLANFDSASVWGNFLTPTSETTSALAVNGSNDVAFVVDPFGTLGSEVGAGSGIFDVAGALADDLQVTSLGDFVFHILPLF